MPTDAMTPLDQIKAAAKAVVYEYNHPASGDGALWDKIHALEDALTAAAEAGPDINHIARTAEVISKAKQETVAKERERCAQVAEWFFNIEKFSAAEVAARIRALKDEP